MKKFEYFTRALRDKAHYNREWVLRAMSVVLTPPTSVTPWQLRQGEEGAEVYVPTGDDGWHWEALEGVGAYEIPFVYHDWAGSLEVGDVENVIRPIENTTWGDILFNSRVLVYACGAMIPYTLGPINLGDLETAMVKNMIDDPLPGEEPVPGRIHVFHYLRFGKAVGDLAGYELFVPSVTERALQSPPNRNELRDKLVKQYEGQLEDPVIQTKIQTEMVNSYKDWIKGDPSEGFIYKSKSINTALKRMFLIHGPEAGFEEGGRATLILNSLEEGIDTDQYPVMVNSLRAGSYYRGALTALAGEDVDLMGRVFQNVKILPDFCGTPDTYDALIDNRRLGRNFLIKGKMVKITEENLSEYQGQTHGMYSPAYCKATRSDCCAICIGDKLAAYPESMGSMVGDIPSTMMLTMMGSAHAKELKTVPIDIANFLR